MRFINIFTSIVIGIISSTIGLCTIQIAKGNEEAYPILVFNFCLLTVNVISWKVINDQQID